MKKVYIIINPASGTDEAILSKLHRALQQSHIDWDIRVTKTKEDIHTFITEAHHENVDCIALYGGDGTISEAARILAGGTIPLLIIPGGSANIMAKELLIANTDMAINLMVQEVNTIKHIDMGVCNETPFLLRVSTGVLADMVKGTDAQKKAAFGQLAYTVGIVQGLSTATLATFACTIDGKSYTAEGLSLMVANTGNVGFSGMSLLPEVTVDDGVFDIFVFNATAAPIHWKGTDIKINRITPPQSIIADDVIIDSPTLEIHVKKHVLPVVIPQP